MKLALIAPTPIPASTANSIQFMKMAQAFARLGHELQIYAPGKKPQQTRKELIEHYGLQEDLDITWMSAKLCWRRYDYAVRAVKKAKHWGADMIFTRLPQAAAWSALRGIPTIFEVHDMPSGKMGPRLLSVFLRARGGNGLVVISKALVKAITQRYPIQENDPRIHISPDAVDLERYIDLPSPSKARKSLGLANGFTVGYTGHLYAGRGISFILDLAEKKKNMQFLLVGGRREDVKRVEREINRRALKNVTLTGFIPNAQLPLYQAAADVLLMPYETRVAASSGGNIASFLSPMKMFEYLASARPILASDLPVLGEVLNAKNAVVMSMVDTTEWVKELTQLSKNQNRRTELSQAARQTSKNYSWESRAEKILTAFAD